MADALRVLQELEPGWSPLYFVTDDSQIEQNGIDDAFPAPYTPRVFLCTVHTMRTWRRKINDKHLITLLITALHKTTEAGCDLALKRALEYARTLPQPPPRPEGLDRAGNLRPEKASVHQAVYLVNTVIPKKHRWALYMRSTTPALLQLATTNAAESYHRLLKRGRGRGICNWGVAALFEHVVRVNLKRFKDAKIAMELSNTKKVTITKEYPGLEKLPYNVQRLLAGQAHAADVRRESGKAPPTWIKASGTACGCKFYRKWLLPCCHYFHAAEENDDILTPASWEVFAHMFEELGYEVYLKTITVLEEDPAAMTRTRRS